MSGQEHQSRFWVSNALFCCLLLLLLAVYFSTERSVLHFSRNLRRFYFLSIVSLLSYWVLSALQNASSKGIEVLMVFVVIMASVVEDKMERALYLTPFSSAALDTVTGTPEAFGKAELLVEIVRSMNRWQGFSIGLAKQLAWLDGSLHKHQAAIHQVLEDADKGEINFILAHVNCAFLLEVAAEKTVDILTNPKGRLKDLTTLSRAILVDGFQKIGLRHRTSRQLYAHRILLETRATGLCALKAFLDDAPDHHTTFKLVYSDFQGGVQQKVLEHVSSEGKKALAHFLQRHPALPGMTLKVVSDIDDTLMCSGGHFPAGSDLCYPRGCVYPGVLAFYRGLDAAFAAKVLAGGERKVEDESAGADSAVSTSPVGSSPLQQKPATGFSPAGLTRMSSNRVSSPRRFIPTDLRRIRTEQESRLTQGLQAEEESGIVDTNADDRATVAACRQTGGDGSPSGGLASISESGGAGDEDEAESSAPSTSRGEGLLGTDVGVALGAVMPSAGSMQNMVGLTLLANLPATQMVQSQPQRILSRDHNWSGVSDHSLTRTSQQQSTGHLVFLSARPESYKGFTEVISFKRIFEPLVRRGELQGYPVLLLGSLRVGPTALYAYAADRRGSVGPASLQFYQALAAKKLARFKQYVAVYPECCWIFVGDNGQGDVLLAENLVELLGKKLIACFIHEVVPLSETVSHLRKGAERVTEAEAESWCEKWRSQRIYFGQDYITLAAEAHQQGLLDEVGLHCVAMDACQDLRHVSARFSHSAFDRRHATKQLNSGIAAANTSLPPHLQVQLLNEPQPLQKNVYL